MTNTSQSCPVSTAAQWAVSPATMSFAICLGNPCCRCVSSGTLLCWTLVLGEQFTRRDGIELSLRLVKRPREPSKRSTAKGFTHHSPRIDVPPWMPRHRWYRSPRHFPRPMPRRGLRAADAEPAPQESIQNLMQNCLNSFFEFGDVRAAPVRLPTLWTHLKVVIVQTCQRFQSVDDGFFGYGGQQGVAAQTPDKRRKRPSEAEAPDHFRGLFQRFLGSRKVPCSHITVHQQGPIARKERAVLLNHRCQELAVVCITAITHVYPD